MSQMNENTITVATNNGVQIIQKDTVAGYKEDGSDLVGETLDFEIDGEKVPCEVTSILEVE